MPEGRNRVSRHVSCSLHTPLCCRYMYSAWIAILMRRQLLACTRNSFKYLCCVYPLNISPFYFHLSSLRTNLLKFWGSTAPVCRYAAESIKLACQYAYRNATPGSTLAGDLSLQVHVPIIGPDLQISQQMILTNFFSHVQSISDVLNNIFAPQMSTSSRACQLWKQDWLKQAWGLLPFSTAYSIPRAPPSVLHLTSSAI